MSQTPEQHAMEDNPGSQPSLAGRDEDVTKIVAEEVDKDEIPLGAIEDVIRSR